LGHPRGYRVAAQDVRDLTHWKVEDRDASHEILQYSGDRGPSLSVAGLASASRARAHATIFGGPLEECRMFERDAGGEAHRTFAASSEIEIGLSHINDPKQGARLVRAFLRITDPTLRLAIVQMVEDVGSAIADRMEISRS
jgi:hypothetical protein